MKDELSAIVYHIVKALGRVDGRTRLVKLVYLADLETAKAQGRPASGARWFSYAHGPFSRDVLTAVRRLDGRVLEESVEYTPSGDQRYTYLATDGGSFAEAPRFDDPATQEIVERVVREWGRRPLRQLLDHVYATEPFKSTAPCADIELAGARLGSQAVA